MTSPEIRKGDFVYRDTLFAEVGDGKRHPRAALSELKDLLMPKKGSVPAKDQVAHWYEAQLIHYGLTRSKEKNTAKVRLTAALSTDGLKVPSNISKIEAEMKKEYIAALRKLKAAEKKAQVPTAEAAPKGKKRKADEGDSTKITVKVDGVELTIDRKTGTVNESVGKRKKAEAKAPSKAALKPKPADKPRPDKSPKAAVPSPTKSKLAATPLKKTTTRPKQTARRSKPFHYPSTSSRPTPHSPQPYRGHTPASSNESDVDMEDAPPPYDSIAFTQNDQPPPVQISGMYTIDTEQTDELILRIDRSKQQLWGEFSIAAMKGVLFMEEIAGVSIGETKTFAWRAEDTNSGQFLFRRDQSGWLRFDGHGTVRGCFSGLVFGDDIDFDGYLNSEDAPDAPSFRFEWDAIPRRAYGRANN